MAWIDALEKPSRGVAERWREIGAARAGNERGWYEVDIRGMQVNIDDLDAMRLAGASAPSQGDGHSVREVVQERDLLRVKVAEFANPSDPHLWCQQQPPTFLQRALLEGIEAIGDTGLAHDLAAGRLAPRSSDHRSIPGFTPRQHEAHGACLTPGVHIVWGPPGTGKTRVLAEAIARLIEDGKRVLLTSSTNIAVDNALHGVMRHRSHGSGTLVRVGPPHLAEVARDPDVVLSKLVEKQLEEADRQRRALEQQLVAMQSTVDQLAALEPAVEDFDPDTYHEARRRLAAEEGIPELASAATRASERRQRHQPEADAAARQLAEAQRQVTEVEPARAALAEVTLLQNHLATARAHADGLVTQVLWAKSQLDRLEYELGNVSAGSLISRVLHRAQIRQLRVDLVARQRHLSTLTRQAQDARALADQYQSVLATRGAELLSATGFDTAPIAERDRELAAAQRTHAEVQLRLTGLAEQERAAREELARAQAAPRATEAMRALVARAEREDLVRRYEQVSALRARVAAEAKERTRLEEQYEEAERAFEKLRKDAEGEIIQHARLVATTLARLRTNKAVLNGAYDVVLVDEVGAATLPEVLVAVSRAGTTSVLLGDFMQLGPVLPNQVKDSDDPHVKRWLQRDAFAGCGITSPEVARTDDHCIALDTQYRFGPDVMGLANAIAYDGLLQQGRAVAPRAADDPEVVLIDTDQLGDLAWVRPTSARAGWWPAGALLSRVLAEYHLARDEQVGVVTPYRHQVDATLEALRDREGGDRLLTEVGTAHRFQGREFPIVIFDLVEDDGRKRWMASATRHGSGWHRDGVRLFNVAVTRTQTRLYLIGSKRRIDDAAPGTPLAQVAMLLRARRARMVNAVRLITAPSVPEADRLPVGAFSGELAEILAEQVQVLGIDSEREFYDTMEQHLGRARRSIWIWAPWTGARTKQLLPVIEAAVHRGIRVTVFVRGPGDTLQGRPSFQEYEAALRAAGSTVVAVHEMHQKIVVIDESTVLLGSLNVLSNQPATREVMLVMRGRHFARKLLEHENARQFAEPPQCGACGRNQVDLRRRKDGWYWRCYAADCGSGDGNRRWSRPAQANARPNRRRRAGSSP